MSLFHAALQPALDANASPISGATWNFYLTGTTTPTSVYANNSLGTSLGSVVTANAAGRFATIFLNDTVIYRAILKDAGGSTIKDIDPANAAESANLRTDLAAETGADLVGTTGGATVQDALDLVQTDTTDQTVGIGSAPLTSRLTVQTSTAFTGNAQHIYHYAQQTDPTNQTSALAVHNYTDGVGVVFDNVGAGYALRLKQANNAAARADKAAGYVGTGAFFELQRARPSGGGVYPNGNIAGNNDRLTFFNEYGNLCFYGADAQDWTGGHATAPIQIGTYEHFLTRKLYLGYWDASNKSVIGSIDTTGGVFTNLDIAALNLRPIGDNAVGLGADSLNFTHLYTYEIKCKPGTVAALPSAVTAGAGTRRFVTDANATMTAGIGAIVAGGGANKVPVYSDGNDWRIG